MAIKYHVIEGGGEVLTSPFGMRKGKLHKGADYVKANCAINPPRVVTPFAGRVTEIRNTVAGPSTDYLAGNYVLMDYGNGYQGRHYHLKQNSVKVKVGQTLSAGSVVGVMGYTGNTSPVGVSGTHLHYELRHNNTPIDPVPYLTGAQELYSATTVKPPTPVTKPASIVAAEIVVGSGGWGNGDERRRKLEAAGYNYREVQNIVNSLIKGAAQKPAPKPKPVLKSTTVIAKEVINGKWGNGDERKKRLADAGYDYPTIQKMVNKLV